MLPVPPTDLSPPRTTVTSSRGKYAVLGILLLAFAMAAFAWTWNFEQSQRCLELYGGQAANLIRTAPTAEILEIAAQTPDDTAATPQDTVDIAGVPMTITKRIDISHAPGLLNARTALIDDASFDWTDQPAESSESGRALVRFGDGIQETLLYFNFANRRLMVLPEGRTARLVPKAAAGWRSFITRHTRD